jgi:hypothetical protein
MPKIIFNGLSYGGGIGTGGGNANLIELTKAEYDALEAAGEVKADTLYLIKDGNVGMGNLSSLIKTKEISETADSSGCISTGLLWSDGVIPLAFRSMDRYGWRYSFLNGAGTDYDQVRICMFDTTLITGDITGVLYYMQM